MKSDRASLGLRGKSFGQSEGSLGAKEPESGGLTGQEEAIILSPLPPVPPHPGSAAIALGLGLSGQTQVSEADTEGASYEIRADCRLHHRMRGSEEQSIACLLKGEATSNHRALTASKNRRSS